MVGFRVGDRVALNDDGRKLYALMPAGRLGTVGQRRAVVALRRIVRM